MKTKLENKLERRSFGDLGVVTGRVRKKRSANTINPFQSNGRCSPREKHIAGLYELFGLIDGFKTMFQEAGDTEYRSDEIELAGELGFIERFSREETISLLTTFRSNRIWPARSTVETSSAKTAATDDYPKRPHVLVTVEGLGSAEMCRRVAHASQLMASYHQSQRIADLEEAIEVNRDLLAGIPMDHADRGGILASLGALLGERYRRLDNLQDLQSGIGLLTEAKAHIPWGNPDRERLLFNLSNFLSTEGQNSRTPDSIQKAIGACEEALLVISSNYPHRAIIFSNLGRLFEVRYEMFRQLKDLGNAIKLLMQGVATVPRDSPGYGTLVGSLCMVLYRKDQRGQSDDDRDQAIKQTENAVAANPTGSPGRAAYLNLLGLLLSSRFRQQGNSQDLEQAINRAREAVHAASVEGSHPTREIGNLSNHLSLRYGLLGTLGDLEESIKLVEGVITKAVSNEQKGALLGNLSNRLLQRYERLGAYEDLDQAIKKGQEALERIPANGLDRAGMLVSLSAYIFHRCGKMGMLEDLERAIKLCEEGVVLTPGSDPNRAQRLSTLSMLRFNRFKRLKTTEDLSEALKIGKEAVEAATKESPDWPRMLGNVAAYLHARHQQSGRLEDLEEATEKIKVALAITPVQRPRRPCYLGTLADCLSSRYDILGNTEDIEEAISHIKEAIAATPTESPALTGYLHHLTHLMCERLLQVGACKGKVGGVNDPEFFIPGIPGSIRIPDSFLGNPSTLYPVEDYQHLLSIQLKSLSCTTLPPLTRIVAAQGAVGTIIALSVVNQSSPNSPGIAYSQRVHMGMGFVGLEDVASCILGEAMKLFPQLCPRSVGRDDQKHVLSHSNGFASRAASMASMSGKEPAHCLQLLELGRGVIHGLVMDCRSDLSELQVQRPDLAARFNSLRMELDSPITPDESSIRTYERNRDRKLQAVREFDEALVAIRNLPNFERFQMPPTSASLIAMAQEGPIVTINCGVAGTEAYIVSSTGIKSLPLSRFDCHDATKRMRELGKMTQGKRSTYTERNKNMADFLLWLWDAVVEPICDALQFHPTSDGGKLPRVWWIGVGPLAMAPFHAAGDHSPGSTRNTFSRAISSYISTIKALSYAREGKLELLHGQDSKLLIVTMPKTPGQGVLKVTEEASKIIETVRKATQAVQIKVMERPAADVVLDQLTSYQAVHFACHGVSDTKDPSKSHLLLVKDDGSESGIVDTLTVEKATSRNMRRNHAQIAYLSACNTAAHMSEVLADESIHIASGFQLAGFPHVLASLWKSEDSACQVVAAEFYRLLFDGNGDQGHSKVSHSFHHATIKLRESLWRQPIRWASFIHTGA